MADKQREAEWAIAERMIAEDARQQKLDAEEGRHRKVVEECVGGSRAPFRHPTRPPAHPPTTLPRCWRPRYQRSLGRAAEERVSKFMRERTVGGSEMLDPTGREGQLFPSSVTRLKPHGFGLGAVSRGRPDIVDMVQQRVRRARG